MLFIRIAFATIIFVTIEILAEGYHSIKLPGRIAFLAKRTGKISDFSLGFYS